MNDELIMMKVGEIIDEAENVKTLMFFQHIDFTPGQFVMVWIPGLDEKPFTISCHNENEFGITVFKVGEFTTRLFNMKKGDSVGIRGSYGNGYSLKPKACAIGGGVGMASIAPLATKLDDLVIIQGAKTSSSLLYRNRFPNMELCTDDGSAGIKGYPTDLLPDLLKKHGFSTIYTCGPEVMMKKVFDFCQTNKLKCESSLERFMKCGVGVCGQCVCGSFRVCTDGPVFSNSDLSKMNDFGYFSLLKSGKRVPLNNTTP